MVSNGFVNEKPMRELAVFIDAANIDLKSFSEESYARLCSGRLKPVLNTLKILKEAGVWLEITNLVIPGLTDSEEMIKEMCDWLFNNGFADTPLHFSRFFPLYRLGNISHTPESALIKARNIASEAGLRYVYIGNLPGSSFENTLCPQCHKVLLARRGFAVIANNLNGGDCRFCGEQISGVWF
jgi:pyruvate formate lyase activating enzyme